MRTSIILTSALALFASASPGIFDRATLAQCKQALNKLPKPKTACSSFLSTTITPCPTTITTTKTSPQTVTLRVTSAGGAVTETKWNTVSTTSTITSELHAPSRTQLARRAPSKCPSTSKPTNVPKNAVKQCNRQQFALACSAIGVNPRTTTLPRRTITQTKTSTPINTVTITVMASPTSTATVTSTTTKWDWTTVTSILPPPTQSCFKLLDSLTNEEFVVIPRDHGFVDYKMASSGGTEFSLTDESGQYGYLFVPVSASITQSLYVYTDSHWYYNSKEPNVDLLNISPNFSNSRSLLCSISKGLFTCASTVGNSQIARHNLQKCTFPGFGHIEKDFKLAFASEDHQDSEYCTAMTLKVGPCGAS